MNQEESFDRKELIYALEEAIDTLSPRERVVIYLRYGWGVRVHTYDDIKLIFGVSRQAVEQMEKRALEKLRRPSKMLKVKRMLEGTYG
jgi:RNA polymerase sigma factor (sigma-70 family)|tara:strand:- start:2491 stop:2754 length:264 start_codon:yes stop_codon:yes gene_type:complete